MLTDTEALRRMCTHEAGHAVAATAHGVSARAIVFLDVGGTYSGRCEPLGSIADPAARRAFGLAGAVAVALHYGVDIEALADLADARLLRLHPADARWAAGYTRADVQATARLLLHNWPDVETTADRLMQTIPDRR